jgi:chromosome condensin MukBEF complex kleisin-like MukF subunit
MCAHPDDGRSRKLIHREALNQQPRSNKADVISIEVETAERLCVAMAHILIAQYAVWFEDERIGAMR